MATHPARRMIWAAGTLLIAALLPASFQARQARADELVDTLVGNVFVPVGGQLPGFDSREAVVLVVDGYLPNSCYRLAETRIQRGIDPDSYVLRQYAVLRTKASCPPGIVPFTRSASLGRLPPGRYRIFFDLESGRVRDTSFDVDPAPALPSGPETGLLARMASVQIANVVNGIHDVQAELTGSFSSSCQFIQALRVIPEPNNTIVILPLIGETPDRACTQILRPFRIPVELGRLGEGRYLLEVLTGGTPISRAFSVVRPDPWIGSFPPAGR